VILCPSQNRIDFARMSLRLHCVGCLFIVSDSLASGAESFCFNLQIPLIAEGKQRGGIVGKILYSPASGAPFLTHEGGWSLR